MDWLCERLHEEAALGWTVARSRTSVGQGGAGKMCSLGEGMRNSSASEGLFVVGLRCLHSSLAFSSLSLGQCFVEMP